MRGLGATGSQQSKDCAFEAGKVAGAPLRISWFLVIFFVYQLVDAVNNGDSVPKWVLVARVTGYEFILLLTVLCHEMGHGTMARRCGGEIAQVLLWPFGGICFTSRAQGRNPRQKLIDDLWIVGAGPATHFPMAAAWVGILSIVAHLYSDVLTPSSWSFLVPFGSTLRPCGPRVEYHGYTHCFGSWTSYLMYDFAAQAIQLNVLLFVFNVFFPMYPMDGAKLIVCTLQLCCKVSAQCAARVLVYTSIPLAILFIANSVIGLGRGSLQPGLTAYMGFMCLRESYKIWKLMKEQRLHTHPLFELARSPVREVADNFYTLNNSDRDDPESAVPVSTVARPSTVRDLQPFGGQGRALGGETPGCATAIASEKQPDSFQVGTAQREADRAGWLQRLETDAAARQKTVRQLENERAHKMKATRDAQ